MKTKAPDRRIQRTRQLLHEALLALVLEKDYEDITIQEIIDRANVGRSTFYAHFMDKKELLVSGFAPLQAELEEHQRTAVAPSGGRGLSFSRGMFEHMAAYRKVGRMLLGTSGGGIVYQQIQQLLTGLVRREIDALVAPGAATPLPREIVVEYAVSAFMGLATWWTEHEGPETPEQMDSMYQQLTWPGVLAGLGLARA